MREELKKRVGKRGEFHATFHRTGVRRTDWGVSITALLVDVRDEAGTQVCDHLWFLMGKQMQALGLCPGDRVRFVATVASYRKRDKDFDPFDDHDARRCVTDYRLIYPSNMRKLSAPPERSLPLFEQPQERLL